MKTKKPEKNTLENYLKRLEEIVERMEKGEISLDESVELYEEGVGIAKECAERLKNAELKIKKLSKDVEGQFKLEEFDKE